MSSRFETDYGGLGSATKMLFQYCYVRELENKGPGSNQDLATLPPPVHSPQPCGHRLGPCVASQISAQLSDSSLGDVFHSSFRNNFQPKDCWSHKSPDSVSGHLDPAEVHSYRP